jgi:hypothetical protein
MCEVASENDRIQLLERRLLHWECSG